MAPFNAEDLLNTETSEAGSTEVVLIPPRIYAAMLDHFGKSKQLKDEDGTPEPRAIYDMYWKVIDSTGEVKAVTNQDTNFVKQALWLDLTEEGGFDWGTNKNTQLSRLREQFGQNQAGKPWGLRQLLGNTAGIHIRPDFPVFLSPFYPCSN